MTPPRHHPWLRATAWAVGVAVLAGVFFAYRSPHTVVDLANRIWACF